MVSIWELLFNLKIGDRLNAFIKLFPLKNFFRETQGYIFLKISETIPQPVLKISKLFRTFKEILVDKLQRIFVFFYFFLKSRDDIQK